MQAIFEIGGDMVCVTFCWGPDDVFGPAVYLYPVVIKGQGQNQLSLHDPLKSNPGQSFTSVLRAVYAWVKWKQNEPGACLLVCVSAGLMAGLCGSSRGGNASVMPRISLTLALAWRWADIKVWVESAPRALKMASHQQKVIFHIVFVKKGHPPAELLCRHDWSGALNFFCTFSFKICCGSIHVNEWNLLSPACYLWKQPLKVELGVGVSSPEWPELKEKRGTEINVIKTVWCQIGFFFLFSDISAESLLVSWFFDV